jgi:hypothetical protein
MSIIPARQLDIERRAVARPDGQDPAVVGPAGHDADAMLDAVGQELGQRGLVEQRISAGEQKAVEVAGAGELELHLPLVHAGPDRLDAARLLKLHQDGRGFGHRLLVVAVGIVNEQDVDPVQPEAFQDDWNDRRTPGRLKSNDHASRSLPGSAGSSTRPTFVDST